MPVTPELRAELSNQVSRVVEQGADASLRNELPLPVRIRLRNQALAKSNRPYAFLSSLSLPVSATDDAGDLVVRATLATLGGLSNAIANASSKRDLYDVATIEAIQYWDPRSSFSGAEDPVSAMRAVLEDHSLLRVTLFPWVTLASRYFEDDTLGEFLNSSGFNVELDVQLGAQQVVYLSADNDAVLGNLLEVQGIREIAATPAYAPPADLSQQFRVFGGLQSSVPIPEPGLPSVGLLDKGVASSDLDPWLIGSERFDPPEQVDERHGTFVAGLIAIGRTLNDNNPLLPDEGALIADVQVLAKGGATENELMVRIEDAVSRLSIGGPKVWNCSFNFVNEAAGANYGPLAQQMDELADRCNVLFVHSTGNYVSNPLRGWPPDPATSYADRLASPAESVRGLAVGAISHLGGFSPQGMPASYSRRGPGFSFIQKPEVSQLGGDVDAIRMISGFGVRSIVPENQLAESVGTSFSTPFVSVLAAHLWDRVSESGSVARVTPALIKGLIAHGAVLANSELTGDIRNYLGWGTPPQAGVILANNPSAFTTVHEVVLSPGNDWVRTPFPVPRCLFTSNGKLRADITLTLSYAPPIRPEFGAESIRYDVEGGFGRITPGTNGRWKFNSVVPHDAPESSHLWESSRLEAGKWAPIKTYRHVYPQGTQGADWGMRLALTERVTDEIGLEQTVYAILTFRGLDDGLPVYSDGLDAVAALSLANRPMIRADRIRV